MRNSIHAQNVNVIVDRQDRNDRVVAGIRVAHGVLPTAPCASYPRAGACATTPGHKTPGEHGMLGGLQPMRGMLSAQSCLPQSWRSRRASFTSRRLASGT